MIGEMTIAMTLLGFNDLGCLVTPTFLFRNRFYLQLSPHCPIIKVLCEQTREANKQIKMSFGLCLILFGFGNIGADFHVLFRVRGN